MGCATCGQKYRAGMNRARTRFQRVGRRRTPVKMIDPKPTVTVQAQQEAPIAVPEQNIPVDHATGTPIAVIKDGSFGEMPVPNTLPQPEDVVVVDTPGIGEN